MAENGGDPHLASRLIETRDVGMLFELFPAPFWKRIILSFFVCGVCGGTSLFLAYSLGYRLDAVLFGSSVFVILYALLAGSDSWLRMWRLGRARRAILIGFTIRMFSSILFPAGMVADIITGGVIGELFGFESPVVAKKVDFAPVYALTIVHGLSLNLCLWGLIGVLYGLFGLSPERVPPRGICIRCGYDLRASPIRCPECGEPSTAGASLIQPI